MVDCFEPSLYVMVPGIKVLFKSNPFIMGIRLSDSGSVALIVSPPPPPQQWVVQVQVEVAQRGFARLAGGFVGSSVCLPVWFSR